jgi:hypothetical protein
MKIYFHEGIVPSYLLIILINLFVIGLIIHLILYMRFIYLKHKAFIEEVKLEIYRIELENYINNLIKEKLQRVLTEYKRQTNTDLSELDVENLATNIARIVNNYLKNNISSDENYDCMKDEIYNHYVPETSLSVTKEILNEMKKQIKQSFDMPGQK